MYCKARSDRIAQENLDNTAEPSTSDTQPALNVKPATKLVEYSLSSDEEDAQPREQNPPDAPPAKKPKKSRKAYSAKFKLRVLEEVMDKGPTDYDIDIAEKYGIEKSLIPKWMKKYDDLENAVASEVSADCKKLRRRDKHQELYTRLYQEFDQARRKGRRVSFKWIHVKARNIHKAIKGPEARLGRHIVSNFIRRYNIKLRGDRGVKLNPRKNMKSL